MSPLVIMLQFAVLAYALVAGVFLAFSDFIMRSLALTGGTGGVEAMQVINREVFRWVFMTLFLGMAAVSVVIAGYAWVGSTARPRADRLAALVYLVGCFGVTVVFNVPMNEALAGMELTSEATRDYWLRDYVPALDVLELGPHRRVGDLVDAAALRAPVDDAIPVAACLTPPRRGRVFGFIARPPSSRNRQGGHQMNTLEKVNIAILLATITYIIAINTAS
jgi:uncharacterized membrane protein